MPPVMATATGLALLFVALFRRWGGFELRLGLGLGLGLRLGLGLGLGRRLDVKHRLLRPRDRLRRRFGAGLLVAAEDLVGEAELGGRSRSFALDALEGQRQPAALRVDLERAGVEEVLDLGLCTGCRSDLFYSHRKQGPLTGRNLAAVARVGR
jgi:hypothetical protein